MEWILTQPWPWYISGPLIGLTLPLLLIFTGERFGVSQVLKHSCSAITGGNKSKIPFLKYDWKKYTWNLVFVLGILLGGFIGHYFMSTPSTYPEEGMLPDRYDSLAGFVILLIGGFLIGFGTRYADGCTSGHAITGLSMLQWSSLVATISFFVGGLLIVGIIHLLGLGGVL